MTTIEAGVLYVVATPIGNLDDLTLRALAVLRGVEVIAAEDTRNTSRLLDRHGIQARLVALHEHNERSAAGRIIDWLRAGRAVALVSDAGTPGISDPGALLVEEVRAAGCRVVPLPGPCAAVTALSAAGQAAPRFLFCGFLPSTAAARRAELEKLRETEAVLVLYEAPHRIEETVADLCAVLGGARRLTIARELTKLFEQIETMPLADASGWLAADTNRRRGEFVLLIGPAAVERDTLPAEAERVLVRLLDELPLKRAVRAAADITGARRNLLYARALALRPDADAGAL